MLKASLAVEDCCVVPATKRGANFRQTAIGHFTRQARENMPCVRVFLLAALPDQFGFGQVIDGANRCLDIAQCHQKNLFAENPAFFIISAAHSPAMRLRSGSAGNAGGAGRSSAHNLRI
jgi:hypothetical protein